MATGRVGYATRVQDWTRVTYPMCPVTLATGHKPYLVITHITSIVRQWGPCSGVFLIENHDWVKVPNEGW